MSYIENNLDVIVIGGGHAGCEAGLASARLGLRTIVFAVNLDSIAMMPCNPSIGGTSKGHLVREIDALGGEMGRNIDKTYIQSRMLNTGKGPAVHSLRAQADKNRYSKEMKRTLENQDNLLIRQNEVTELIVEDGEIRGVKIISGSIYYAKAVVIATGTYLKARCIYGDVSIHSGPNGLQAANHLTESLKKEGIELYRFKTGTPARIDMNTVDFSKMDEQKGDRKIVPFSFVNREEDIRREQISCWLTYTNAKTHEIISENLHRSPYMAERSREQARDTVLPLRTRWSGSMTRKGIRFSLSPKGKTPRRCMSRGCPVRCLKTSKRRCIEHFPDWRTVKSCARHTPSSTTASIPFN